MKKFILSVAPLCLVSSAFASLSFTGTELTENFNSLTAAGTWTNNSTLPGWHSSRTAFLYGTGSSSVGGQYSFGVAGTNAITDRALGSLGSGSTSPIYYGVAITNNTGANLLDMTISYRGEQWRTASSVSNVLTFGYKVGATTISESGYVANTALDFTSLTNSSTSGAMDGNASGNFTNITDTITFVTPVADGSTVWLRWLDIDNEGSDPGLAIDDFSFTATTDAVPEPATMTILAGAAALAALRRRKK